MFLNHFLTSIEQGSWIKSCVLQGIVLWTSKTTSEKHERARSLHRRRHHVWWKQILKLCTTNILTMVKNHYHDQFTQFLVVKSLGRRPRHATAPAWSPHRRRHCLPRCWDQHLPGFTRKYGSFHSHGGSPIAGWFVSWKICKKHIDDLGIFRG